MNYLNSSASSRSGVTLEETLLHIYNLICPIKIMFNDIVLYNDYDSKLEIEPGVYGEILPPHMVVPERIKSFRGSLVNDIHVSLVQDHHTIIVMTGTYINESD